MSDLWERRGVGQPPKFSNPTDMWDKALESHLDLHSSTTDRIRKKNLRWMGTLASTGAAAGLLSSNIIARDLGLTDKQEIVASGDTSPWNSIKAKVDE